MKKAAKFMAAVGWITPCGVWPIEFCFAADEPAIVFDCIYDQPATMKDFHAHIVADANGITITQDENGNSRVRNYTKNGKVGGVISYYRKDHETIIWGTTMQIFQKFSKIDSSIDRRTGVIKNAGSGDYEGRIETGTCIESRP